MEFMDSLAESPMASLYSPLYPKHSKLLKQNDIIKQLVFQKFDAACECQLRQFLNLFDNVLSSSFSNPWIFIKGSASAIDSDTLSNWLQDIPTNTQAIDVAVEKVQVAVLKTYA